MTGDKLLPYGTSPLVLSQGNGGKLKALAMSTKDRSPLVLGIPGIAEACLPGYNIEFWYCMFLPVGTPGRGLAQ